MPPSESPADADIMLRVQAGELEQFATLIRRYQPALLRVARSRLGDATWAEDVVQETFLAVYKARHTYDPRRNFRTWLWTILINQCHTHGQRRSLDQAYVTLAISAACLAVAFLVVFMAGNAVMRSAGVAILIIGIYWMGSSIWAANKVVATIRRRRKGGLRAMLEEVDAEIAAIRKEAEAEIAAAEQERAGESAAAE